MVEGREYRTVEAPLLSEPLSSLPSLPLNLPVAPFDWSQGLLCIQLYQPPLPPSLCFGVPPNPQHLLRAGGSGVPGQPYSWGSFGPGRQDGGGKLPEGMSYLGFAVLLRRWEGAKDLGGCEATARGFNRRGWVASAFGLLRRMEGLKDLQSLGCSVL